MSTEKLSQEQKPAAMTDVGINFAVILKARQDVVALEKAAAPSIKKVVDSFGPGPHKMPVPNAEGGTTDMIVTFRKSGDTYSINVLDLSKVT